MKAKRYNSILILIGLLIFIVFIWVRFIRERLPRDIPFELSLLGFIFLFYICLIYVYMLYSLIYEKKLNGVLNKLIYYIFIPLETLDHYIKNLPYLSSYYKRFIIYFVNKLVFILLDSKIYYCIMYIVPRIILVSALLVDTFYFHCLFYIYKVLIIGLLLLLNRYIIYSLKYAKEHFITNLEPLLWDGKVTTKYVHEVVIEIYGEEEDDDDDDSYGPTMSIPLKNFIDFQTESIMVNDYKYNYIAIGDEAYREKYCKKHNIFYDKNILLPDNIRTKISEEIEKKIENITKISLLITYYQLYNEYDSNIKRTKIIIFSSYLLCWSYILIISFHTLSVDTFIFIPEIIDIEDPFSQLNMENNLVNEQQKEITLSILTKNEDNNDKD